MFRYRRQLPRRWQSPQLGDVITDNTYSIHFYGRRFRQFLSYKGGCPEPDSYLDMLLKRHDIDTAKAPVLSRDKKDPKAKEKDTIPATATSDKKVLETLPPMVALGAGGENLTDLANKYGSDKGSSKHRYTEL